ncbi:MATE family efflux transporter [Mucilaginibacter pedocola]|uniref:Polysaccharide biosynthesis protein C-terminal domain-containing protein n=1 Tax=Mucilaginibacter pedocola TaxID=1792845 RepID=A0A1S9P814_9SPHI|nr:hypothetical protein [Mucilaginibacter pedocola]OOQ57095.1 hypothetical protein BC343_16335 [Mucilaginibacter pedocola]
MSKSAFSSVFSGSVWGIIAKGFDSAAKFITIPMLVHYFGKSDYGLIALAFSLNTYLRLMDLGMNVGSIRFFSMWVSRGEDEKISKVSRSSIVFYGVIGLVNAAVFLLMSVYAGKFFNLTPAQLPIYKWIMYILAVSTVLNWLSNVVNQLLSAQGLQGSLSQSTIVASIFNFATAVAAVTLHLSLPVYFVMYTLSTLIVIPMNVYKLKVYKTPLWKLISPKWNGKAFKEILGYSMAIFAIGIFQQSADSLRPILLGKYSTKGIAVLTDYRIIQTITMIVIAFGTVFMQVLIPSAAKILAENDQVKLKKMVHEGTKYISLFLSLVVFGIITNAQNLLLLYMGPDYTSLSIWLIIWLLTVLIAMHNAPVASLALSSGNTKPLVYMSAVSCFLSLPITVILAGKYNVGAAVMGYFAYIAMQVVFYYSYYVPRVLKLSSGQIFMQSFFPPFMAGLIACSVTYYLSSFIHFKQHFLTLGTSSVMFFLLFAGLTFIFIIKKAEIAQLKQKLIKK